MCVFRAGVGAPADGTNSLIGIIDGIAPPWQFGWVKMVCHVWLGVTLVGAMMLAPARSSAVPLADAAQSDAAQSDAAQSDAAQSDAVALKKSRARGKGLRQQRSTRYMRVVARSLRLTEKARGRLLRIAERYFDDTGRKLVITGGDRTARGQARLMYKKLERGEDLIKLYARDDLVTEIMDAYEGGKADGLGTNGIVRAMAAVIKDQMANDQYVSRHLQFTAADVRSRRMTEEQHAAFVRAVRAEPGVRLVDERDTASPHLHLNL